MPKSNLNRISNPPKADRAFLSKSKILRKVRKLPKSPGVYVFYGLNKEILYVGKATSLKDRVRSYFSLPSVPSGHLPSGRRGGIIERPVDYAISQIADVKVIKTDTVLEAFILEQDLIKRLQPKYNAMGKDDKSFSYVVVTKEMFPRFVILRKTEVDKIFNLQFSIFNQFSISKFSNKKPLSAKTYQLKASKIYGPYTSKKQIEIALKILRKIFPYHSKPQKTEKGCLDSQIELCPGPYDGKISRADYLKNIRGIRMVLEGKKKNLIKKLEKEMKSFSKINEFEKAAEVRNKIFALKHIRDIAMINNENFSAPQSSAFPLLANARNSSKPSFSRAENFRIEAYDISNISGQFAVGSMVVFDDKNGQIEPNKSEYRKFKIKTIQGADDVGMLKEILTRRFKNNWPASTRRDDRSPASPNRGESTRGWTKPNLILLDGGKGQLYAGEFVLHKLNLKIPLVAVAKGEDRKKLDYNFSNFHQFSITKFSNEILKNKNLIKQIIDEAHRFAIAYHKKIRKSKFIT